MTGARFAFAGTAAHGTRMRYTSGCRCDACRHANAERDRARRARIATAAAEVRPTGPPIPGTMRRGGRDVRVLRCPGADGRPCVRGGAWLRGPHAVCGACVERATVWDGRVSPARARAHLLRLRAAGVGYKAVAAACDVPASTLGRILAGRGTIRASTERRVLAVDEGARADRATVDAAGMNAQLAALRARGFTLRQLAELLGYQPGAMLQLGKRARAEASTAARVARLARRVERGEVAPRRALADATAERAWLAMLMDRGVSARWLSSRLGFVVTRAARPRMWPANAAKVRALRAELEALVREGDGLPDDWQFPASAQRALAEGFGFEGGFLVRGRSRRAS